MLSLYEYGPDTSTHEGHACNVGCENYCEFENAKRVKNPLACAAFTLIHPERAAGDNARPQRALRVPVIEQTPHKPEWAIYTPPEHTDLLAL